MNVALYLRRSTNERLQAESLHVQEALLRRYARAHHMKIVAVFRDSASGTTVRYRTGFLSMTEEITHGARYSAVLVRDVTRFGRFYDPDEAAFYEVLFQGHGVTTIYVEEVFGQDTTPMAGLLKNVKRVIAAEYSRDRSRIVRSGSRRVAELGFRPGAMAPYGFRREMVEADGRSVGILERGQWKAIQSCRIRLVLGPPEEAEAVRAIFGWYAGGVSQMAIAERLNARGTRSPTGRGWGGTVIRGILLNPAYTGRMTYRPSIGEPVVGRCSKIVEEDLWAAAQGRRAGQTRHTPNVVIAASLRHAYELNGCVEGSMFRGELSVSWPTIHRRFCWIENGLELAYREEIAQCRSAIDERLRRHGMKSDDQGWIADDGLLVSFRPIFIHRSGDHLTWKLRTREDDRDAIVCAGIQADRSYPSLFFAFRSGRSTPGVLRVAGHYRAELDDLESKVQRLRRKNLPSVESKFLEVSRSRGSLNLAWVARQLGWPHHSARDMFRRLRTRGEWFPPLFQSKARFVRMVCPVCGKVRNHQLCVALTRKSALCHDCWTKSRPRIPVHCPDCGKVRLHWPSAVRALSSGAETRCRACWLRGFGKRFSGVPTDQNQP